MPSMQTHADPLRPFTESQERVAELLADGLSAPSIATELDCSYHTVRAHIRTMALVLPGTSPAQERVRAFALARRARARESMVPNERTRLAG